MSNEQNQHTKYYNSKGEEVPSTTTVLKLYAKNLEPWANYIGKKGIDYKTFLQQKADLGTYIHSVCEKFFSSEMEIDKHPNDRYMSVRDYCILLYHLEEAKRILASRGYQPYAQELTLHGEKYGGTLDLLFYNKELDDYILVDLKTAKDTYNTMYMQLMAYCDLLLEIKNIHVSEVAILLIIKDPSCENFLKFYSTTDKSMNHYRLIFNQLLNIYYLLNEKEMNKLIS